MITLRVNNEDYIGFTEVSMSRDVSNLCGQVVVKCTAENSGFRFPIKRGSHIESIIEGYKIFDGYVEKSKGRAGENSFDISVEARDKNSAIIKSSLRPNVNFKGPISLIDIIKKTLKKIGISRNVIDKTGGIDDFTRKEIANEDIGTEIFEYWVTLAAKRNCVITGDVDGNIVLQKSSSMKYDFKLYRLVSDPNNVNNIIESAWDFDDSERCHEYNVYSQYNMSVPVDDSPVGANEFDTNPIPEVDTSNAQTAATNETVALLQNQLSQLTPGTEQYRVVKEQIDALSTSTPAPAFRRSTVATKGTAIDTGVPYGSERHEIADDPSDDDECERLAKWKCNVGRVKSVSYSCTVNTLLVDGKPWAAGTLIDVVDEIADIDATLMIKTVEYKFSKNENGISDVAVNLTFTIPDAYSDTTAPSSTLINTNKIGENWNDGVFK